METTFLIAGILLLALLAFGRLLLGKTPEVSDKDSANSPDVKGPFPAIQLGAPEGYGADKFQDHSTDIYSMSAGTIGLEGSAWRDD